MMPVVMAFMAAAMPVYEATVSDMPDKGESISVDIERIEFRDDITRIYCTFVALPHTAHRIDAVTLSGVAATDMDGADLGRYFQTEDSGRVKLEIDFPPVKFASEAELVIKTVIGETSFHITRRQ